LEGFFPGFNQNLILLADYLPKLQDDLFDRRIFKQGCRLALVPYGQMQLNLRPNSPKKAKFFICTAGCRCSKDIHATIFSNKLFISAAQ